MQEPRLTTSVSKGRAVTVISHREYIGDILGSVAFNANRYEVNPGLLLTFPWLSTIANNWDSYLFKKLDFVYETSCASTTAGSVMLAIDFDAADPTPLSKVELMTYDNATRSASWQECSYDARLQNLHKFGIQRFTRQAPLATSLDIKTYDVGNLFVATSGQADASMIGELYVDYVVELYTPQIAKAAQASSLSFKVTSGGSVSKGAPFGTAPSVLGDFPISVGTDILNFQSSGEFLLNFLIAGTGLTSAAATMVNTTGITSTFLYGLADTAGTSATQVWKFKVTQPGTSTITVPAGWTTVTGTYLRAGTYAYSLT